LGLLLIVHSRNPDLVARSLDHTCVVRFLRERRRLFPVVRRQGPDTLRLMRRKNHVVEPLLDEHAQRLVIAPRLRKPQRFGSSPEPMSEVREAPANLRATVPIVAKGQNRVPVALRNGIAMSVSGQNALAVRSEDLLVGLWVLALHPG
jgi:hypothetical protein